MNSFINLLQVMPKQNFDIFDGIKYLENETRQFLRNKEWAIPNGVLFK